MAKKRVATATSSILTPEREALTRYSALKQWLGLSSYLSTNAIRLLYQFINTEIDKLTVRYAAMIIKIPSMAWPV
jgi:hypothetical protein